MTSLNFQLRISYFWSDCITIWSERSGWSIWLWGHIKYHVTLKVTLTFGFNGKVIAYSFFYCLICQFITPQILDWDTSGFQLRSLRKGTSGWQGIWWSIYLNWNISFIYCRFEIKLILVKAEWWWLLVRKNTFLCHFRSRRHDVIKFSILDISLI